jgi:hypothetical protein
MPHFEVLKKLPCVADLALFRVLQALTDTFLRIASGGDVKEALIGLGILYDCGSLALHSEHHGALGLFQLFHEIAGPAAESCQRLNVFSDVEHSPPWRTFLGASSIAHLQ